MPLKVQTQKEKFLEERRKAKGLKSAPMKVSALKKIVKKVKK